MNLHPPSCVSPHGLNAAVRPPSANALAGHKRASSNVQDPALVIGEHKPHEKTKDTRQDSSRKSKQIQSARRSNTGPIEDLHFSSPSLPNQLLKTTNPQQAAIPKTGPGPGPGPEANTGVATGLDRPAGLSTAKGTGKGNGNGKGSEESKAMRTEAGAQKADDKVAGANRGQEAEVGVSTGNQARSKDDRRAAVPEEPKVKPVQVGKPTRAHPVVLAKVLHSAGKHKLPSPSGGNSHDSSTELRSHADTAKAESLIYHSTSRSTMG